MHRITVTGVLILSALFPVLPSQGECRLFPTDNIWNTPISGLPVDSNSAAYVTTIGAGARLKADFGSGTWNGGPIGIPYMTVSSTQALVNISFEYADESDPGPYPIPPDPLIEGGPAADGDRHILLLVPDQCRLYEIYAAYPNGDGTWRAGSGAKYDLNSHALRPDTWTSADAAGLPIMPGLVRYDEVAAGEIRHAIRFTSPQTRRAYVWPARHYASSQTGAGYPPMGQRFRLRADYDISGFPDECRVILTALKQYGMILADNGSAWYMSGAPDERWDNDNLQTLRNVPGSAFEAVDVSSLMVHPDSGQARRDDAPDIRPMLQLNGQTNSLTLDSGQPLTITISLDADNSTAAADWWVCALAPDNAWYAYTYPAGWQAIAGPDQAGPAYQGALFDLAGFNVFDQAAGLMPGAYTIYFGVDLLANGRLDDATLVYTSVAMIMQPAAP